MHGLAGIGMLAIMAAAVRRMEMEGDAYQGDMTVNETTLDDVVRHRNLMQANQVAEEEPRAIDRPVTRQQRRQMERLRAKGRG